MNINCLAVQANPGGALHPKPAALSQPAAGLTGSWADVQTRIARLLVALFVAVFSAENASAAAVNLTWNSNPESNITGYRVSYGSSPGVYPNTVNIGTTPAAAISGLSEGVTYYFVVAAVNQAGLQGEASAEVSHMIQPSVQIPSAGWTLQYADSQESADYQAAYAFDGDPATIWHTAWSNSPTNPPHEIQINLGSSQNLVGFKYQPRGGGFLVGNVGQFEFYVSADGVNWGNPVATGTFPNTGDLKEVRFTETAAKYVRFRGLSDANGGSYMSVAELYLLQGAPATGTNQAPVATAKSVTATEDTAVAITLSGTDADGNSLTYSATNPGQGSLSGTAPNLIYTPKANFNGSDSFTFRVNDGTVFSASATVSITVNAVNDAPVATSKSVTTLQDTALPILLTGSDVENSALTFSILGNPSNGILSGTPPNVTYQPNSGFSGNDQFTFKSSDGSLSSGTATVSITVSALPPAGGPTVLPRTGWSLKLVDSEETFDSPGAYAFDGNPATFWHTKWRSGSLPTLPHEIQLNLGSVQPVCGFQYLPRQDGPAIGNIGNYEFYVSVDGTNWGTPVATGTFANTQAAKQITFTSKSGQFVRLKALSEANGTSDTCIAELNILKGTYTNQAPVANPQSISTESDTPIAFVLSGSDAEGNALTYSVVSSPAHGTLSGSAPNLSYLPDPDYVGNDQFTFRTGDGAVFSTVSTVSITVNPVSAVAGNFAPAFTGPVISDSAPEDQLYYGQLIANDANPGDFLTFRKLSGPAWLEVTPSGALIGTPLNSNVGISTFSVKVADQHKASATATVVITVRNANDPPVFKLSPIVYPAGTEKVAYRDQSLANIAFDPDSDDTFTYAKTSGPAWLTVAPNGTLGGTPPSDAAGINQFTIRATDAAGASAEETLQIKINSNTLPLPWKLERVGRGNLAGPANYAAGVFTVAGAGALDAKSDAGNFGWQNLSGSGQISAQIEKLDNTGSDTRVGLMIRDSLEPDARQVFIGVNGKGGLRWFHRSKAGEKANESARNIPDSKETWLKLVRTGGTITAYRSANGTKWVEAGSIDLKLPENCYIGLSVSSGDKELLNTSKFSNVRVTP